MNDYDIKIPSKKEKDSELTWWQSVCNLRERQRVHDFKVIYTRVEQELPFQSNLSNLIFSGNYNLKEIEFFFFFGEIVSGYFVKRRREIEPSQTTLHELVPLGPIS